MRNLQERGQLSWILFAYLFFRAVRFLTYRRRISHNTTNLADFVSSSVPSQTIVIRSRENRNCPYKIFQRELPSFFWNGIVVTTLTLTYFMFYSAYVRISITLATGCSNKILSNPFTILFHRLKNDLVNDRWCLKQAVQRFECRLFIESDR